MKKLLLSLMLVSLIFVSCKKDEENTDDPTPTPTPTNTNFSYVKQGTVWTYIYSDTDPNNAGVTFEGSYTITAMDAQGWCNVTYSVMGFNQPMEWYADNTQWATTASKAQGTKFTLIKANPILNDEYSMDYQDGATTITNTRKVKNLKDTVTVSAGTYYNCVVIHETTSADPVYYKDYWIEPGVGIVRTEGTTTEDFPVIIMEELKSKTQ